MNDCSEGCAGCSSGAPGEPGPTGIKPSEIFPPNALYELHTSDHAAVVTFRSDIADRFAASGGQVSVTRDYLSFERTVRDADKATGHDSHDEWIARWEARSK